MDTSNNASYEVDSARIDEGEDINENRKNLLALTQKVFNAIFLTFCNNPIYISLHKETKLHTRKRIMYTTNEEGLLNNYAVEPPVYYAEFPSPEQQQQYALQGAIATLLVTTFVLVAFAVG